MGEHGLRRRPSALLVLAFVIGAALAVASPLAAAAPNFQNSYTVTPLVSDQPGVAAHTDPNLVNAWGLTAGPMTPWWVSDNGTDVSTLYGGDGTPRSLVVSVPGGPTGTAFNPTAGFVLPTGGKALFLFDGEDGIIRGWNMAQGTSSVVVKDRSDQDAIYKGLTVANTPLGPRLYAADFHNSRIDVFNRNFNLVPGGFHDPFLPDGYAPFNVQVIGNLVFVAYAKQDEEAEDEEAGPGLGFVDAYSLHGRFFARIASRGPLNAPWGLAVAPPGFGRFSGDLLVGNFGDGTIHAYRSFFGFFFLDGTLRDDSQAPVAIDGLWALRFGNDAAAGSSKTLFFTAGPDEESHGLFGTITHND